MSTDHKPPTASSQSGIPCAGARHIHQPVEFGSEKCAVCGENFRSEIHLRSGEIA